MKTDREKVKETKNLYLRRNTMNATRLTLIGLAAAALIAGGCSRDNRIAGPDMQGYPDIVKNQSDLTYQVESESNAARVAVRDDGSAQQHLSIVAEVFRTEVEGGCWYLSTENGDNYTPLTPKSLTLKLGMTLKADGYVDKSIIFFCGLGPAFVIEQYEVLDESNMSIVDRAHLSGSSDLDISNVSPQDATSVQKFDKKISRSDAGAASNPVDDDAINKITRDNTPQTVENQSKNKIERETSGAPTEDRAPAEPANDDAINKLTRNDAPQSTESPKNEKIERETSGAPTEDRPHLTPINDSAADWSTEDRAPQASEYEKKKLIESETSGVPTEDRAPVKPTNDGAIDRATEDRAPQASEYEKKKLIENETSGVPTEDRAPAQSANDGAVDRPSEDKAPQATEYEKKKMIESETSGVQTEDRAPANSADDVPIEGSTEDRAPQGYGPAQKDVEMKMHFGRPVPIIYNEAATSGTPGINTLEGYTHFAKGGCLMLTSSDKEVFEIQHDTDAILKDGYYIRVTGYMSTLAVVSCEDAPVFYAETLKILWRPEKSNLQANDKYVPANEASNQDYIEEEGVMHRTGPEGGCWYFENDKGDRFELLFSNQVSLRSGMHLKVKGVLVNLSTFCGSGKPLQVAGWEVINENKF